MSRRWYRYLWASPDTSDTDEADREFADPSTISRRFDLLGRVHWEGSTDRVDNHVLLEKSHDEHAVMDGAAATAMDVGEFPLTIYLSGFPPSFFLLVAYSPLQWTSLRQRVLMLPRLPSPLKNHRPTMQCPACGSRASGHSGWIECETCLSVHIGSQVASRKSKFVKV